MWVLTYKMAMLRQPLEVHLVDSVWVVAAFWSHVQLNPWCCCFRCPVCRRLGSASLNISNCLTMPFIANEHLPVDSHQVVFLSSPKKSVFFLNAKEDNIIYLYLYSVLSYFFFFSFLFCGSHYRPVKYVVPFYISVLRAPELVLYCLWLHLQQCVVSFCSAQFFSSSTLPFVCFCSATAAAQPLCMLCLVMIMCGEFPSMF